MLKIIDADNDGYIFLRRADYLYRLGKRNEEDFKRMGDGDIVVQINPKATVDIRDAQEIVQYINQYINNDFTELSEAQDQVEAYNRLTAGLSDLVSKRTDADGFYCQDPVELLNDVNNRLDVLEKALEQAVQAILSN